MRGVLTQTPEYTPGLIQIQNFKAHPEGTRRISPNSAPRQIHAILGPHFRQFRRRVPSGLINEISWNFILLGIEPKSSQKRKLQIFNLLSNHSTTWTFLLNWQSCLHMVQYDWYHTMNGWGLKLILGELSKWIKMPEVKPRKGPNPSPPSKLKKKIKLHLEL